MQFGGIIHQVRILVFDKIPKVSMPLKIWQVVEFAAVTASIMTSQKAHQQFS